VSKDTFTVEKTR